MNIHTESIFEIPKYCPVCSSPTLEKGKFLFCPSKACPAKLSGAVRVWVKRLVLLQWGDALIDALTDSDQSKIQTLADLYRLTLDDIAECCSGAKVTKKCYDTLHANKSISLELFLASQNIQNLALSTSTDIVQAGYDTLDKVLDLTFDQLVKIPNIGNITAEHILQGFAEKRASMLDLASVVDIKKQFVGALTGKSFCITLTTAKPRKILDKMILDAGGLIKGSVGSGLSFLVCNYPESDSSKLTNARKYSIPIIPESELYQMLGIMG